MAAKVKSKTFGRVKVVCIGKKREFHIPERMHTYVFRDWLTKNKVAVDKFCKKAKKK